MHQPLDDNHHNTDALRQRMRRALANDLNLPEQHVAVTATLKTFSVTARAQVSVVTTADDATATLDTWWSIVAHTHAIAAK